MNKRIELYDGKYTYINDEQGQRALRHGEPWRDLVGDGLVLAMAQRIEELEAKLQAVEDIAQKELERHQHHGRSQASQAAGIIRDEIRKIRSQGDG
jgi:hypothetical protein